MTRPLLFENARIVDPHSGLDKRGSLLIENGKISDIAVAGPVGVPDGAEVVNAQGMVLSPGLIDMRVFTGEPGHEYRETLASASRAAAAGGVTSFVVMPDTAPVIDDGALVDFLIRRAEAKAKVRILPSAAITKGLEGKEITEFGLPSSRKPAPCALRTAASPSSPAPCSAAPSAMLSTTTCQSSTTFSMPALSAKA
jgi:dihydroorotase